MEFLTREEEELLTNICKTNVDDSKIEELMKKDQEVMSLLQESKTVSNVEAQEQARYINLERCLINLLETKPSQHFLEIITENKVFFQKKVEEMENCFAQSNYEEMGNCYSELKHFFIQKFDLLNQETQQVKQNGRFGEVDMTNRPHLRMSLDIHASMDINPLETCQNSINLQTNNEMSNIIGNYSKYTEFVSLLSQIQKIKDLLLLHLKKKLFRASKSDNAVENTVKVLREMNVIFSIDEIIVIFGKLEENNIISSSKKSIAAAKKRHLEEERAKTQLEEIEEEVSMSNINSELDIEGKKQEKGMRIKKMEENEEKEEKAEKAKKAKNENEEEKDVEGEGGSERVEESAVGLEKEKSKSRERGMDAESKVIDKSHSHLNTILNTNDKYIKPIQKINIIFTALLNQLQFDLHVYLNIQFYLTLPFNQYFAHLYACIIKTILQDILTQQDFHVYLSLYNVISKFKKDLILTLEKLLNNSNQNHNMIEAVLALEFNKSLIVSPFYDLFKEKERLFAHKFVKMLENEFEVFLKSEEKYEEIIGKELEYETYTNRHLTKSESLIKSVTKNEEIKHSFSLSSQANSRSNLYKNQDTMASLSKVNMSLQKVVPVTKYEEELEKKKKNDQMKKTQLFMTKYSSIPVNDVIKIPKFYSKYKNYWNQNLKHLVSFTSMDDYEFPNKITMTCKKFISFIDEVADCLFLETNSNNLLFEEFLQSIQWYLKYLTAIYERTTKDDTLKAKEKRLYKIISDLEMIQIRMHQYKSILITEERCTENIKMVLEEITLLCEMNTSSFIDYLSLSLYDNIYSNLLSDINTQKWLYSKQALSSMTFTRPSQKHASKSESLSKHSQAQQSQQAQHSLEEEKAEKTRPRFLSTQKGKLKKGSKAEKAQQLAHFKKLKAQKDITCTQILNNQTLNRGNHRDTIINIVPTPGLQGAIRYLYFFIQNANANIAHFQTSTLVRGVVARILVRSAEIVVSKYMVLRTSVFRNLNYALDLCFFQDAFRRFQRFFVILVVKESVKKMSVRDFDLEIFTLLMFAVYLAQLLNSTTAALQIISSKPEDLKKILEDYKTSWESKEKEKAEAEKLLPQDEFGDLSRYQWIEFPLKVVDKIKKAKRNNLPMFVGEEGKEGKEGLICSPLIKKTEKTFHFIEESEVQYLSASSAAPTSFAESKFDLVNQTASVMATYLNKIQILYLNIIEGFLNFTPENLDKIQALFDNFYISPIIQLSGEHISRIEKVKKKMKKEDFDKIEKELKLRMDLFNTETEENLKLSNMRKNMVEVLDSDLQLPFQMIPKFENSKTITSIPPQKIVEFVEKRYDLTEDETFQFTEEQIDNKNKVLIQLQEFKDYFTLL